MGSVRRHGRSGGHFLDSERRISTATLRGPSHDVRKRMNDIYDEMEQNWKNGRFRLPLKFVSFHDSDIMFLFVRAAIGYALAFVKVKSLQRERVDRAFEDPKLLHDEHWRERIAQAVETQASCATAMSSAYARLVLHCSNYENHKEDEHFFECVYFFVCSVVKLSVPVEYWKTMEEELGFLFRGAQFSSNVKTHTVAASAKKEGVPLPAGAAAKATTASSSTSALAPTEKDGPTVTSPSSAAKTIQNLSASTDKESGRADSPRFVLPTTRRASYFTESVPVKKIVSGMDATKSRAARNIEVSQAIRERIEAHKAEAYRQQLEAVVTPRQSVRLDLSDAGAAVPRNGAAIPTAKSPSGAAHRTKGFASPRIPMKTTYTTRSPALNHLLPSTEERVRLVLRDYEQELQQRLQSLSARSSPDATIASASPKGGRRHELDAAAAAHQPMR